MNVAVARPKVILIDVYETMLDMSDVEKKVNALMDSRRGYAIWSGVLMQYCFAENCMSQFHDFPDIARVTMEMTMRMMGRTVQEGQVASVLELFRHVPLHEDVQEGLSSLRDLGFRIAALTNSSGEVVGERMERTGLVSYFEQVFSADEVKKYKPCRETYEWAVKQMKEEPNNVMMVTSHPWDAAGAANAGLSTALVSREGEEPYPLASPPGILSKSFTDFVAQVRAL